MSATTQTIITCDGSSINCGGSDWSADSGYLTAREQRKMARRNLGWHYANGKDFCRTCWLAMKAERLK